MFCFFLLLVFLFLCLFLFVFFFNDTATTEIYTLSLHDALPIYRRLRNKKPSMIYLLVCSPPYRRLRNGNDAKGDYGMGFTAVQAA